MSRRPPRVAIAAALAVVLAGCTAARTVYNHLDWWASWQLGKFVDLDGPQEALFESGFQPLWDWHRSTQLTLYAADLRELARAANEPLSSEQVADFLQRATAHSWRVLDEAMPATVRLLQSLDDAQVREMVERLDERREDRAEEAREMTLEELADEAAHDMRDSLKTWLGRLTPEQNERVARWAAERRYDPALEGAYQEAWLDAYADLLASRARPDFGERLRAFFREPPVTLRAAVVQKRDANRRLWIRFMSELSAGLSERQRKHLRHELRELAELLDELAAEQRGRKE